MSLRVMDPAPRAVVRGSRSENPDLGHPQKAVRARPSAFWIDEGSVNDGAAEVLHIGLAGANEPLGHADED